MFKSKAIKIKIIVIFRYLSLILFLPFSILIAIFIKLVKPLILIRWTRLDNARIGHFATDVEMYL